MFGLSTFLLCFEVNMHSMATPTAPFQLDVLVVGCGIAGLTAAVACREKGFNVMVLESLAQFSHVRGQTYGSQTSESS